MRKPARNVVAALALAVLPALVGACSDAAPELRGIVQNGGTTGSTGVPGAQVTLYAAGSDAPRVLGSTTTGDDGRFSVASPDVPAGTVRYLTATRAGGIELVAVLGETRPASVTVNELTTVAAAFAFAQLYDQGAFRGTPLQLRIAAGMSANLADPATGASSSVLTSTPNADQTNSLRATRNLANLIAVCVAEQADDGAACARVFEVTTPGRGPVPTNTLEALINVARHPASRVGEIYGVSYAGVLYAPPLEAPPDAWTLTVKVNRTGSDTILFGGSANTVFDDRGYAWINDNTLFGTSQSSNSVVVLKPDGSPADGRDGTPRSPISGGGILGPGFGISRSVADGSIWVGNFGWGGVDPGPGGTGTGSVSQLAPDGTPISPRDGWDGGTDRVQGIVVDRANNVWSANFGNNRLVVFRDGDPARSVAADMPCHPFGIAMASDGTAWVSTAGDDAVVGDATCDHDATLSHFRLGDDGLELLSRTTLGKDLKGVDVDLEDHAWAASGGDDTVYRVAPNGAVVGAYRGGGIDSPWAVRIDDAGNVWVANFGRLDPVPPNNVFTTAALSVLAGPNNAAGLPVGAPISPPTGYTVPSAGAPVLLGDGTPLGDVGTPRQPAYTPFMRVVSVVPDRAGNVWASNNWKPNFTSDLVNDPGGDGMVIFVGVAAPTEPGRTQ